jgi:peptide deformylase
MLSLVNENDPILTRVCDPFDFADPPFDPIEFAHELVKFMRDNDGLGLAGPQVGVPYRVFSMRADPNKVFYNPRLVWQSEETIVLEEGCLSFPNLICKVKRSRHVKVRYEQPNAETMTETFTGMAARCILHEVDHLNGVLFYNLANRYHRELALKQRKKTW